jgi:hypothetical protein
MGEVELSILEKLDAFLAEESFFDGPEPSSLDAEIFQIIMRPPPPSRLLSLCRWHRNLNSYSLLERQRFPKSLRAPSQFGLKTMTKGKVKEVSTRYSSLTPQ